MVASPDHREKKTIPQLLIRRFQKNDTQNTWQLHVKAMGVLGVNTEKKERHKDFDTIEEIYIQNGGDFIVGEVDGKIVAMGGLRKTEIDGIGEVVRMRVDPHYQRLGYGSQILSELENRALKYGYHTLTLSTSSIQEAALAFYPRKNYVMSKRELSSVPKLAERGIQIVTFQKTIK